MFDVFNKIQFISQRIAHCSYKYYVNSSKIKRVPRLITDAYVYTDNTDKYFTINANNNNYILYSSYCNNIILSRDTQLVGTPDNSYIKIKPLNPVEYKMISVNPSDLFKLPYAHNIGIIELFPYNFYKHDNNCYIQSIVVDPNTPEYIFKDYLTF